MNDALSRQISSSWLHAAICFAALLPTLQPCRGAAQIRSRSVGHLDQDKLVAKQARASLIGIQYEQWFDGPDSWKTAEAIPLLGKYKTDETIISKHFDGFHQLGIDWLLIDWSNMLWIKPAWEQHTGTTKSLEDKTSLLFQVALRRRQQRKYAPKLVLMLGLQNGPPIPNGIQRLNAELTWLKEHYLDRPEYQGLWLYDNGKPLITILYWPPDPCTQLPKDLAHTKLESSDWTVRWMASQLQDNHAERCGMWSWMDGVIPQIVTRHGGAPEDLVVTPSSFELPGRGWASPTAIARDHGVPYLQSWRAAFESRPKFIQIHQWNEFAGQENGHGLPENYWGEGGPTSTSLLKPRPSNVYADEFNVQLSDDIEPTELHSCGYRDCGGWGYYYFNLTRAIISLYRGETSDITVLALSGPTKPLPAGTSLIPLHWAYLGVAPTGYSLSVDGKGVSQSIQGTSYELSTAHMLPGKHEIKLTADGVHTYFSLDPERSAALSPRRLPVESTIVVNLARTQQK